MFLKKTSYFKKGLTVLLGFSSGQAWFAWRAWFTLIELHFGSFTLSEVQLNQNHRADNGRACTLGDPDGFAKRKGWLVDVRLIKKERRKERKKERKKEQVYNVLFIILFKKILKINE